MDLVPINFYCVVSNSIEHVLLPIPRKVGKRTFKSQNSLGTISLIFLVGPKEERHPSSITEEPCRHFFSIEFAC